MASFFIRALMKRHLPIALLLAFLALAFCVYFPGTSGYFLFDDTINIINNDNIKIQAIDLQSLKQAAFSGDAGMLGRPISMVSFAFNYYFSNLNPFHFKLTNIIIHLVNGLCIYILTLQILSTNRKNKLSGLTLSDARWESLVVASAWLLHPLNLTSVLYIVQRMTSLATLFSLLGLISYMHGRQRLMLSKTGWGWILLTFVLLTPLAIFSKENGALLPVFVLGIELFFFRFETVSKNNQRALFVLFGISVLVPAITLILYLTANPAWITGGYSVRDFTLTERLMTEARVLWFYIQTTVAPNISQLGMYHDDIFVSKSLLEPASTIIAILGIFLLLIGAFLLRKRAPVAAFGLLFFLAGHSIESSVIALELVHEHRNYLPIYGLLLPLFYYLLQPDKHPQSLKFRRILAAFLIFMFAGVTFLRATQWGDHFLMKEMAAHNHPNSIRSNIDIGALYAAMPPLSQEEADAYYQRAYDHFKKATLLSTSDTLGLFGLMKLNSKNRLPIQDLWVNDLAYRIEHHPFSPNSANSLVDLEKCVVNRECILPSRIMGTLFQSALNNTTLQGKAKAQVLLAWADFLFRMEGNRKAAEKFACDAASIFPNNPQYQIPLINILINMGNNTAAEALIEKTKLLDKTRRYAATLNELEKINSRGSSR